MGGLLLIYTAVIIYSIRVDASPRFRENAMQDLEQRFGVKTS